MKVKLLKKVRKNFRIIRNGNRHAKIQERHWYGWDDLSIPESYLIYRMCITPFYAMQELFRKRYSKYSRREKIYQHKEKTWTKVWYNENLSQNQNL
jgi:hypothetical protein